MFVEESYFLLFDSSTITPRLVILVFFFSGRKWRSFVQRNMRKVFWCNMSEKPLMLSTENVTLHFGKKYNERRDSTSSLSEL